MGQNVLRKVLAKIKSIIHYLYSIIDDEATDIACNEQFHLSIRYVDDDYDIHEDAVGLFALPITTADTLSIVLKDLLICCDLPLCLCGVVEDRLTKWCCSYTRRRRKGLAPHN